MYNISEYNINTPKQTGWICPKCGRVMAPTTVECIYCNRESEYRLEYRADTATIYTGTPPINNVVTTSCNDSAQSTCECDKKSCAVNDTIDTIEPMIMIRKLDKDGNLVDEKNMTREELKKMDSILERVLGDLANTL